MNKACLMKRARGLRYDTPSLWIQVLRGKYGREGWDIGVFIDNPADSNFWKSIVRLWPKIEEHRSWVIGNGQSVHAWQDKWLNSHMRLRDHAPNLPDELKDWRVSDLVDGNRGWKMNLI